MLHTGKDHPASSVTYCMLFAISWRRREMKILQQCWMVCCPRNIKLEAAVLEGAACTCNIALSFSNDWMYRKRSLHQSSEYLFEKSADRKSFHRGQNLCSQQILQQWSDHTVPHTFFLCKIILSISAKYSISANHSASCCCNTKVKLGPYGRGRWFPRGILVREQ